MGGRGCQERRQCHGERFHRELASLVSDYPRSLDSAGADLRYLARQEPLLQSQASASFEHEEKLLELRRRSTELEVELGLMGNAEGTEDMDGKTSLANESSVTAEDAGRLAEESADDEFGEEVEEAV